jgi:carbonic anhydrase
MKTLIAGYKRFRANAWPDERSAFESLAKNGQSPGALVVACVDSRADPGMIFDTAPGEMLSVRNVANLVPPYQPDGAYHGTSAALEFGVKRLEVRHLVVLGHSLCGGVRALLEGTPERGHEFVTQWMSIAESAHVRALSCTSPEDRQQICEHEVIRISLSNIMTFPWVAERVADGRLSLHGAWFDIRTGVVMVLQPDDLFAPLE